MKTIYLNFIIIASLLFFMACEKDSEPDPISGCTDSLACNYNSEATEDDGSCQIPLDNPIEITYVEDLVIGSVDSLLVSHIYVRNASCETMTGLLVEKMAGHNPPFDAYFCFNGICFTSITDIAPNPMSLASFEEDDYFKGYLSADSAGTYEVKYQFFIENSDPMQLTDVTITYEVN